jgi:hypothetical protein
MIVAVMAPEDTATKLSSKMDRIKEKLQLREANVH